MALKVFVDTDVVISSLISSTGAAFLLFNQTDGLDFFISDISAREIETVTKRLHIDTAKANSLIARRFSVVQIKITGRTIQSTFDKYVLDNNDAHIVAGAKAANVQFLISYNTRHFKADKIKVDFHIVLATPANLLQYTRSL